LAKELSCLLLLRGSQVLPGFHAIQNAQLLLRGESGKTLQALAQLLLPLGGQAAEFGIVLQRAVLLIGREIRIAPQPIPRMAARLDRIVLRTRYLRVSCGRRRGLMFLREGCSGNRECNGQARRRQIHRFVISSFHCCTCRDVLQLTKKVYGLAVTSCCKSMSSSKSKLAYRS